MLKFFLVLLIAISAFAQGFQLTTPKLLDLGIVPSDTTVSGVIQFTNNGTQPVKIKEVRTSCGCTMAKLEKMNYQPGEGGQVEVHFNTKGYAGITRKSITIFIEGEKFNRHRIILQADVQPQLEIAPLFIDFQDIKLSENVVRDSFKVKNNMPKTMVVQRVAPDNKYLQIFPESFSLNPGEQKTVEIKYQMHKSGRDDSIVAVQVIAPKKLERRIPVFIEILP